MTWILLPGIIAMLAKAVGLGLSLRLPFRKFLAVKIWLLLMLLEDLALYLVLWLGFNPRTSILYAQVYYWADLTVVFFGLVVLLRLAETALKNTRVDLPLLRMISIGVIGGIGIVSFGTVFSKLGPAAFSLRHLIAFASEAEQNLAAAGMLAAFVLWGALSVLGVRGLRTRRIASGCGIFYSASACGWSLMAVFGANWAAKVEQLLSLASILLLAYAMSERDEAAQGPRRPAEAGASLAMAEQGAA